MFLRVTTLESIEIVDNPEAHAIQFEKNLLSAGILDQENFHWSIQGVFTPGCKVQFDSYLSELSFPITQKEHDFLSKDDNWREYTYYVHEIFFYRLVHIPKTAGRYVNQTYGVYREGPNQNHTTFKSKEYGKNVGLGRYDFNHTQEDPRVTSHAKKRFTIVRNPYDWLVSMYFCNWDSNKQRGWADIRDIIKADRGEDSFEQFIDIICDPKNSTTHIYKQIMQDVFPFNEGMTTQLFDDDERLLVSNIIFFEKIHDGIKEIGLQERPDSIFIITQQDNDMYKTHKKRDPTNTRKDDYKEYYTPDMIDRVAKTFKFDLEFLGYDFNGLRHDANAFTYDPAIHKSKLPLLPIDPS